MGLGHTFLRQFIAGGAREFTALGQKHSGKVSYGSIVLSTALGAVGLFICAPSAALLESQPPDEETSRQIREDFPNAFSRKGQNSGQQEPYMAYNREGQKVPLADIVERMKV